MLNVYYSSKDCDLSFRPHLRPTATNPHPNLDLPLIMHLDGRICWEATDYLLDRHTDYYSIANSTIRTYARHLSRLVQFLDYKKITFSDLTDNRLFELRDFLTSPPAGGKNGKVSASQFNKILQRLFKLLIWLKKNHRIDPKIISDDSAFRANINIEKKNFTPKGSRVNRSFYSHPCKLPEENPNTRSPIRDEIIDILVEQIWDYTDNNFIQARWSCLLEAFEQTGARDSEIASITVEAVSAARKMLSQGKQGKLKIVTTKGKNRGKARLVPIAESSIDCFEEFIKYERSEVINKSLSKNLLTEDHGYLFTTVQGRPFTAASIGSHFREVRNSAGLDSHEAVPHMFRHRYISNLVDTYLSEILANGKDNIGEKLDKLIIRKVQKLTGHASSESLFWYVEDSLERMQVFENADHLIHQIDEKTATIRALRREVKKLTKLQQNEELDVY